ncbi:MAG: twin-arginine translocase TatA/TatE family subunit [Anaerolineae bacterium]|jgi:sec-independent protein translocase protein TatA
MGWIRGWEWIIILVIVLLLFGVGRLGQLGAELGKGIRNFREALSGKQEASAEPKEPDARS